MNVRLWGWSRHHQYHLRLRQRGASDVRPTSSKAGLELVTRILAVELAAHGSRVNAVARPHYARPECSSPTRRTRTLT
ncbi:SDR family oxidoreductase [Bradyrhizobium yuanmingense]|nr:SDR family oxidoreductase [Bradyrhizobium yuanmingense]MVT55979.1 SDR family oxidoreductase [Bradyrhizobium yuanmingense]